MANKVSQSPIIATPIGINSLGDIGNYLLNFVNSLINELRDHAFRLNLSIPSDGSEIPTAPVRLNSYVKTSLPSASSYTGALIHVTNDVGGAVTAFSDGTNWRRVTDRNVIS